jgi:type II secretory pathway predicted ATPase ExeA
VFARPTADDVWLGAAQRTVLSQLSRPAQIHVLMGPTSSGKTTLLQHFATLLPPNAVVLRSRGPKDDSASVLASLLLSADLAPWDLSEVEQRNLLTVFFHQRRSQHRRVLMLIDDAHAFQGGALEELERLIAFKIDKKPALELVLAGPASVAAHWQEAGVRLGAREVQVHNLDAASQDDMISYLNWRLARFDMQTCMTSGALETIARMSAGRFAASDVLCQMSLLLLRQMELTRADTRVVQQAVTALAARHGARLDAEQPRSVDNNGDALPQGFVVVSRGGKVLARIKLGQRTLIGRSEHNDVCLPSPYLSRHHAVIVGTPEGYYLMDLNSVNGVVLNGRRIERGALWDDDVLSFGPFRLKVQVPEWLMRDGPLPDEQSDTAVIPQPAAENAAIWRVK